LPADRFQFPPQTRIFQQEGRPVGCWRAATPRRPASSRVLSINLSPALQAPARHSQFCGQLLGRPNPRFQHPNGITLKLFVKAPAKFTPWFLSVLFHGFRSSLHLSARSKTLHDTSNSLLRPESQIPDTQPIRFRAAEKASVAISLGVPMLPRGIGDTK
jgi:hypothetical protein